MNRILLADDDVELCRMLEQYLEFEGFKVSATHDGESALDQARTGDYDLVVLDLMMPQINGFDALRELRKDSLVPVLMLTARSEDVDSIIGLELGADDYLAKPCNPRILVARVRAILRRSKSQERGGEESAPPEILKIDDLEVQTGSRTVALHGRPIAMTSTEYSVLEVLLREAGHVVTKAELSERALGRELTRYDRSIDMHLSSLRKKLGPFANGEERIKTVRGVGYQYTR